MKVTTARLALLITTLVLSRSLSAQSRFWADQSQSVIKVKHDPAIALPKLYRTVRLDSAKLNAALRAAPKEFSEAAKNHPLILDFPMPDKSVKKFKIFETSIMEQGLAAKFPTIKTYGGQGIDDPYATIKIDCTDFGFHALIFSQTDGSVFIDPYSKESVGDYISYNKKDITSKTVFDDGVIVNRSLLKKPGNAQRTNDVSCVGGTLKQYRLAVACTWEYAVAVAGRQVTPAQALSAIVTSVNRVDGVYETELGIRMVLVNNNDKIVFTDSATQPFTGNKNAEILINESQQVIGSVIGAANYDIGHTFSTGAGGYAYLGVVGENSLKAKGVTGLPNPVGDAFNIDFVAHEMGHQFGANHTFNASTGNCGEGNGNSTTNVEPGSGSTIMAYAGICLASNNLQLHSIPYFHGISFDEITSFINSANAGSVGEAKATGNNPPVVNAGSDYVIPKSTPFALSGSASDPDGDALTYSWEEMNAGGPFTDWNKPEGDAPIFRSFAPVNSPVRSFPQVSDLINNKTTIGEILPSYARTLKFRLTARDNRSGGGGVCYDETEVTVDGNAGPFTVMVPNTAFTTWTVGSFTNVKWDVAGTNLAPVNCKNVNIQLSIDGGLTFPITLSSNTANDGVEEILVPNNVTDKARVRIMSVGNVFFDISNESFAIKGTSEVGFTFNNPTPVYSCNNITPATILNTSPLNKFSTPITLSASGNPAGTTITFGANPIKPGASDFIYFQGNIPPGLYNITVTGNAGSVAVSRDIQFIVGAPTKIPVTKAPANNSVGVALLPTFDWMAASDAQSYTLEISTSSTFASTVVSIDNITDSSYKLTTPLAANTAYYWRVVPHNLCGAGVGSSPSLFKTALIVCGPVVNSENVPMTITTVKNTITSTLTIPDGGIIQDVNVVGLKGTHSYISDLSVTLISPAGTRVQLFANSCGSDEDFDLNFDDQALNAVTCPLNDGQESKPKEPLSGFNNENSAGTWKLEVADGFTDDGGSLNNWGLQICTYQPSALPVNWLTFTGNKNQDNTVTLQWTTANEINNSYYEIEKSIDGVNFSYTGKTEAGNSSTVHQYLFQDVKPYPGESFYRLKQVDKDGHYSYSKIVKVTIDRAGDRYVVYPNPAVNKSTVRVVNETRQLKVQLADASGKVVYARSVGALKAGEEFEIPVYRFSKGLYILTLSTEEGTTNEKIVVQ